MVYWVKGKVLVLLGGRKSTGLLGERKSNVLLGKRKSKSVLGERNSKGEYRQKKLEYFTDLKGENTINRQKQ